MERAITHFENAYNIPAIKVEGYTCKTNLPSNTAFRGFGGPQAIVVSEAMINDIADYLGKDPADISKINFYKEGDLTYYNQQIQNCTLEQCWKECLQMADYWNKRLDILEFNK